MAPTYTTQKNSTYHREYKSMVERKNKGTHLPRSNESWLTDTQIMNHMPPVLRDKTIHHVGVSSIDACTMIVIFTDGTQTNLNF